VDANYNISYATGSLTINPATDTKSTLYRLWRVARLWSWTNDASWKLLNSISPVSMAAGDFDGNGQADVVMNYGDPYGTWIYYNSSQWVRLSSVSAKTLAVGDINADGKTRSSPTFGSPYGIWRYYPATGSWSQLSSATADSIACGDLDGDGRKDVVVDFGTVSSISLWSGRAIPVGKYSNSANPVPLRQGTSTGTAGRSGRRFWQSVRHLDLRQHLPVDESCMH